MKTNAKTLRTLVMDNSLTLGRLTKDAVGSEDYKILTTLYTNGLDALTEWAGKDYAHISTKEDVDNAFTAIKAILEPYATEEDRIIIDQSSMRTMRDCATKPKRLYSKEYKEAEKSRKNAQKTAEDRYDDLMTLKAPALKEDEKTADYVARVRESGIDVMVEGIDMLKMFENAMATLAVRTKKVEDIKKAGNWTWRRPVAVSLAEFADLIENYIADCLMDNYNIKSSKAVRAEQAERRAMAQAEKAKAAK